MFRSGPFSSSRKGLSVVKRGLLAVLPFCSAGCTAPPSISVIGAYFPDWLFCIIGGLLLTVVVRSVLIKSRNERVLGPPVVVFSSLMVLFSLLIWLLFF